MVLGVHKYAKNKRVSGQNIFDVCTKRKTRVILLKFKTKYRRMYRRDISVNGLF